MASEAVEAAEVIEVTKAAIDSKFILYVSHTPIVDFRGQINI